MMSPVYILRHYAWAFLKANNPGWTEADYGGRIPIVASNEEPLLTQYEKPVIIYGYSFSPSNDNYVEKDGTMSLVVRSHNKNVIDDVVGQLTAAFSRQDDAAKSINTFSTNVQQSGGGHRPMLGVRFGTVSVAHAEGPAPEDEEGTRVSGIVVINFKYFVEYNFNYDPPSPTMPSI